MQNTITVTMLAAKLTRERAEDPSENKRQGLLEDVADSLESLAELLYQKVLREVPDDVFDFAEVALLCDEIFLHS